MYRDYNLLLHYYLSLYYWEGRRSINIGADGVAIREWINLLRSLRVAAAVDDRHRASYS